MQDSSSVLGSSDHQTVAGATRRREYEMNNELMQWATGEVVPPRGDRQVAARAKQILREVQEKDMMARGAFALGADIMEQTAMLYIKGKMLAGDEPALGRALADEWAATVHQAQEIQRNLFEGRGF